MRTIVIQGSRAYGYEPNAHRDDKIVLRGMLDSSSPQKKNGIYRAKDCTVKIVESHGLGETVTYVTVPLTAARCDNVKGWIDAPGPLHGFGGIE